LGAVEPSRPSGKVGGEPEKKERKGFNAPLLDHNSSHFHATSVLSIKHDSFIFDRR
jgi:hypothetical protein